MSKTYAVVGSGMQGTAAAYDLAHFADPARILMADVDFDQAVCSAERVNGLLGSRICEPHTVNALDQASLGAFLSDVDVLLSCVPYWMHPVVARVAIDSKTSMVDLGGDTDATLETLEMDDLAKAAGVSVIPDAGLAPGLVNSLGLWLIEHMDDTHSVKLYCGVLPQNPKPPFNYKLTFNVEGLVAEYDYEGVVLRDGEVQKVPTLTELEEIHIEELGTMEAFVTSGGTSTAPYTLQGRVRNYEYKTIRFPGHCSLMRIFKDFGFWREDLVGVKGVDVRPKDVFIRVFGEQLAGIEDLDMCVVRGVGVGCRNGERVRLQMDLFDRQCLETGFTSMERLTGFSIGIYAAELGEGRVPEGVIRYEQAMTGTRFFEALQKRGFHLKFSEERLPEEIMRV